MKQQKRTFEEELAFFLLKEEFFYFCFERGFKKIQLPLILKEKDLPKKEENFRLFSLKEPKKKFFLLPEATFFVASSKQNPREEEDLFYFCTCFRHERTQHLRYWSFEQAGVEKVGPLSPTRIVSLLQMLFEFLNKKKFFFSFEYRALEPLDQELRLFLKSQGAKEEVNLKRGEDYYTKLIFEVKDINQKEIAGGGCYNIKGVEGIGFALGLERLFSSLSCSLKKIEIIFLKVAFKKHFPLLKQILLKTDNFLVSFSVSCYPKTRISKLKKLRYIGVVLFGEKELFEQKIILFFFDSTKKEIRLNRGLHPDCNRDRVE